MSTPTVASFNQKILVGGWTAYAEQHGVNQKEPMETFDWLPPQHSPFEYKDLKAAIEKVDGAKEWLKAYVKKKKEYSFSCAMANQIIQLVTVGHSGASGTMLMWDYKRLLNDWDGWVYQKKRYIALEAYKRTQVDLLTVHELLWQCNYCLTQGTGASDYAATEARLISECGRLQYSFTTMSDLINTLAPIKADFEAFRKEEDKENEEREHSALIGCIEFLYEHPSRWFDTRDGCNLMPGHPSNITPRALDEMNAKYPGYRHHIALVLIVMQTFPWTSEFMQLDWAEKNADIRRFMEIHMIVPGVLVD